MTSQIKDFGKERNQMLESISLMHTMHDTFQSIAERKYQSAVSIESSPFLTNDKLIIGNNDDLKILSKHMNRVQRSYHSYLETIVFSALSLEAYINYYIIHLTSEDYFLKQYRNRSIKDKWLNVPGELKNIKFDESTDEIIRFKETIDARNNLVHFKSKKLNGHEYSKVQSNYKELAIKALQSIKEMRVLLNMQDPPLVGELSGLEIWKRP